MTKEELREMFAAIVEEKLLELVGDPDESLSVKETVRKRLLQQRQAMARGEEGKPFADVVQRLELD